MSDSNRIIIGIILMAIGIICIIIAAIFQMVLIYDKFGVVFTQEWVWIPHWSCWFYCGIIPTLIGFTMMYFN